MAAQPSSSPEECCICADEFTNIYDLAAHLIRHAEESSYKESLDNGVLHQKSVQSVPNPSKNVYPEYIKMTFCNTDNLDKRSVSRSPMESEIVVLDSDSDDDSPIVVLPTSRSVSKRAGRGSKRGGRGRQSINSGSVMSISNHNSSTESVILEKPSPKTQMLYTCRFCSKTFNKLKLYHEHLQTHEKPRPFSCNICKKTFAYRGILRQHLRMHIGDKLHQCPKCLKRFTIKDVLRKHCEQAHNLVIA